MLITLLRCGGCGKEFPRSTREYERQVTSGKTEFFCGNSCQAKITNKRRKGALVELACKKCGILFLKEKKEYDRWIRQGRDYFFCNKSCQSSYQGLTTNTSGLALGRKGSQVDTYSKFRWFILRIKARGRRWDHDVDAPYLLDMWEEQKGICPLTGWVMKLPPDTRGFAGHFPDNASVDRIDGRVGYIRGNVRFVCLMANLARSNFTDEDVRAFARSVNANVTSLYGKTV